MSLISTSFKISYYLLLLFVLSYNLRCKAKTECKGSTYAPGSRFQTNLQQVFSELRSKTPDHKFFYNASVGEEPDRVFGMALCRGDSTKESCTHCLNSTIGNITIGCPNSTTAVIWFYTCLLRYSDKNFFTVANTSQGYCHTNSLVDETINAEGLLTSVSTLLNNMSNVAANSPQLFAVGTANFTSAGNITLYGLAQCTTDLSAADCKSCLANNTKKLLSKKCNGGKRGARIYQESCYIWYNDTRFYISNEVLNSTTPTQTINATATGGGTNASTKTTDGTAGGIRSKTIIMIISGLAGLVVIVTSIICLWKRIAKFSSSEIVQSGATEVLVRTDDDDVSPDTRIFSIEELKTATENFSSSKKLGEGGYGEVYEGIIDGNLVAVKRLFKATKENEQKLMKELSLVSNIDHPNILKLLGYCFGENDLYLFVYEYMPNGSLDRYLKDPDSRRNLNWLTRFKIIKGIAHGLYYLHNGLEKNMIHVDLKLPNILLNKEMTAKIADFDLLRAFEGDETHQSTENIYGTPGYMAPEVNLMAPRKCYSVKSDVYSFGIMVLEIVTGERIHTFVKTDSHSNLMSFVWYHWNRKRQQEVIDPCLEFQIKSSFEQIVRCIHIGLLCIQHVAAKRPDMLQVLDMLSSKKPLPVPSIPGFLHGGSTQSNESGFLKSVLRLKR